MSNKEFSLRLLALVVIVYVLLRLGLPFPVPGVVGGFLISFTSRRLWHSVFGHTYGQLRPFSKTLAINPELARDCRCGKTEMMMIGYNHWLAFQALVTQREQWRAAGVPNDAYHWGGH